jgi:phosphatidylethanolamine-binding protein (PEBP) family uncharacterized protein
MGDEAESVNMGISVTLRDIHRCSRISPEIQVVNIPEGTDYFDVRLVEYGPAGRQIFLGGGTWENDASGIIPSGVLSRHYRGPCPPAGQAREYAFIVAAMSRKSSQPLAAGRYRFIQE